VPPPYPPAWGYPPPQYGPAPLPPAPWGVAQYDEAQPYHRILRTRTYRWWRPLLGLVVFFVTFGVMTTAVTLAALLPAFLSGQVDATGSQQDIVGDIVSTPLGLLGVNLSLAVLIPAAILGMLAGHQLRPGWLHSVIGRFRWRFLLICLGLEAVIWLLLLPLTAVVAGDTEAVPTDVGGVSFAQWLPFALVILLTTPLQAAGEEYGFRGYGMQALGAWVRHPWFAVMVTSLLFAAAHGGQSLPLFLDRLAFGIVAAVLTLRTGGLEAAIAFHVVNNMIILMLASAAGALEPSLTISDASWGVVAIDVLGMLLFAAGALWLARRLGLDTRTRPSAPAVPLATGPPPAPPPGGSWPGLEAPPAPR
jgi:membrane protease YdiL (CAAX protease family)